MKQIKVLDCTLRDGGYCNNWQFGKNNIHKITKGLEESGIDIIESGFLTNRIEHTDNITKYNDLREVYYLSESEQKNSYVVMINYGEYDVNSIPEYRGERVEGIRLAFHKKDMKEALQYSRIIKEKGYKLFLQPMVTLNYTDQEFMELIYEVNKIEPWAFYIVDSFGMMKQKDLLRFFYLLENNLSEKVWIGFHSHNNMQLAYSNAQRLVEIPSDRNMIIDGSIFGMGRGAGNLNTELFLEYLNENKEKGYKIKPLLKIIDEVLNFFYLKRHWGYSLPNYLSASYNAHPNYALFLEEKHTLTIGDMNEIFQLMDREKKVSYDESYIEKLYLDYMEKETAEETDYLELASQLKGKQILVIAPGKSAKDEAEKIRDFANKTKAVTISVNFCYEYMTTNYIFINNSRRYRELKNITDEKIILTSNIESYQADYKVNYERLLNNEKEVCDNAGLMLIKLLVEIEVENIVIAGMDGYSCELSNNYLREEMAFNETKPMCDKKNMQISAILGEFSEKVKVVFLTTEKNISLKR